MISTSDFKNGLTIRVDGAPYQVIWFQHHKPGKGGAVMRVKLRNLETGTITETTFKSGEKFDEVSLNRKKKQFLYTNGNEYTFMDMETYEQITMQKENMGDIIKYLKPDTEVEALYIDDKFLAFDLPINIEMKVMSTVPGIKGDTVSNLVKPAILETGIEVQVPLFIKEGDLIKIDTRTGEYVERVSK
ncbi:MAG: elongation factor P [Elusimicrobia bacterium RIFOXYD2_FULL_34_30]|nr:MAG: elongation factor P [Elusimicrobia bacterium RIFOXYD2_FULL_34_30]